MNIKDIANLAGVGVSTVSRVLNNHTDVKQETRERVLEIIRANNYIPNNSARILKQSNTKNIGILVKGVFNPFFSEILKSINVEIQQAGYTVILQHYESEVSDVGTLLGFIKEKRLQGLICLGGNFLDLTDSDLVEVKIPVILISAGLGNTDHKDLTRCSSISIEDSKAAFMGTDYLIKCGHKNIALVLGGKKDYGISRDRYIGYSSALEANGIEINEDYIIYGSYECEMTYEKTKELLSHYPEVTAIFAISDIMATGAAKASFNMNRKIGQDISIIGFDGMDVAKFYEPSITTIKQPKKEMSKQSIKLLFELLEGKTTNKHIRLDVQLVEGESVVIKKG